MVKNFMKKIIIFIIPFLFILNVNAEKGLMLSYTYRVTDENNVSKEYTITAYVEHENVAKVTIAEYSSDQVGEPQDIGGFKSELGYGDMHYITCGISEYSQSLSIAINGAIDNGDNYYDILSNNPNNYKPILRIRKDVDGKLVPIVIGFKMDQTWWGFANDIDFKNNELYNANPYGINLNEHPEMIDDFLSGNLKSNDDVKDIEIIDFNEKLRIVTGFKIEYIGKNVDPYDIDNETSNNISFTGGSCEAYDKGLRDMREALTGYVNDDGTEVKGKCSAKSLNIMQRTASLYDLEYNFDRSVLEEDCVEFVFGENGYIDRLKEAQKFYQSIPYDKNNPEKSLKYKLICLSAQSEYLKGFSLLTVYTPVIDESDESGCQLIGDDVINFINELFSVIKVLCICVCILLCIVDVYKMVVTKESEISKFKKVLVKRVVALIAVFLIPLFVNIVTELINDRYLKNNSDKCTDVIGK